MALGEVVLMDHLNWGYLQLGLVALAFGDLKVWWIGRTLREICAVLRDADIKTARGGVFQPVQVIEILRRSPNPALAAA